MRVLGVIPARGGSKSVPRKNIAPLTGKPLINYTIEAALASGALADVMVSTDDEAIAGFQLLCSTEGIVPALESAHAIGWLAREAGRAVPSGATVLVTLSGRGDKDVAQIAARLGEDLP